MDFMFYFLVEVELKLFVSWKKYIYKIWWKTGEQPRVFSCIYIRIEPHTALTGLASLYFDQIKLEPIVFFLNTPSLREPADSEELWVILNFIFHMSCF